METTQNDSLLKDFLKKKEIFADFINATCFDGKQILKPDDLEDYDSDHASIINNIEPYSINRNRDIITKANVNGIYMLLAIENQTAVDYYMPLRILVYDALSYNQQYRRYQKTKSLNSNFKFKMLPVHTLVIYYGEHKWNGPKSILDMMELPDEIKEKINNWHIDIVDVKEIDYHILKDKDNYHFIKYLQQIYNWDGNPNSLDDITVNRDVATLIASIAKNDEVLKIIEESEGDEVNMCQSIDLAMAKAVQRGKQESKYEERKDVLKTLLLRKFKNVSNNTMNTIDDTSLANINSLLENIFDISSEQEVIDYLNKNMKKVVTN